MIWKQELRTWKRINKSHGRKEARVCVKEELEERELKIDGYRRKN